MTDENFKEAKQLYEDINELKISFRASKRKETFGLQLQLHFIETCLSKKLEENELNGRR